MNNREDINLVKTFIDNKINWDNYNKSKRRNYRNITMKEYKTDDLIQQLSYMLYEQYHKNVINAPSNIEERKQNIDLDNYVSKEKYDKTKKNSNHYKQQVEQRNSMIKELNDKYAKAKEELKDVYKKLNTLESNYKKLEIEHRNLFRVYSDMKEQNDDLKEENDNLYKELFKLKKQYNII